MVYLDAFPPHDGDSCWVLTNDEQRQWYVTSAPEPGTAWTRCPSSTTAPARIPWPRSSFLHAVSLTGAWQQVPAKHHVAATWPEESPMAESTRRAQDDPNFVVHHWITRHNVLADGPQHVLELIRSL